MSAERTLSIVKPDAVAKNHIGPIVSKLEKAGLKVVGAKMMHLKQEEAQKFYEVHKERPFYSDLVKFMTSGPVLVMVLEGPDAVAANRKVMGATDWQKSETGTIRREFATSIEENAVHGSDSKENAEKEIAFFFKNGDLCSRTR